MTMPPATSPTTSSPMAGEAGVLDVGRYRLPLDRGYDAASHMWVRRETPDRVRCGLDPLGSETSGDIVALSFAPLGTAVTRGGAFGNLEAAKFVGPLLAPVAGVVASHNEAVLGHPGRVTEDPLGHWLVTLEVTPEALAAAGLLHRRDDVERWFAQAIERFDRQGMIAR